jgi:hypothetical protein
VIELIVVVHEEAGDLLGGGRVVVPVRTLAAALQGIRDECVTKLGDSATGRTSMNRCRANRPRL